MMHVAQIAQIKGFALSASAGIGAGGTNTFTGKNTFAFEGATVATVSDNPYSLGITTYGGTANDNDIPVQFFGYGAYGGLDVPMLAIRADGSLNCAGSIILSADYSGSQAFNNLHYKGPFDSSTAHDAQIGVTIAMFAVRSDVNGPSQMTGCPSSTTADADTHYVELWGSSSVNKAYAAMTFDGGLWWDYGGILGTDLDDASISANAGAAKKPADWADYRLYPKDENTLCLASVNAPGGEAHLEIEDGDLIVTAGAITATAGNIGATAGLTLNNRMTLSAGFTGATGTLVLSSEGLAHVRTSGNRQGFVMPRAGSIVGVHAQIQCTAYTSTGSPTITSYSNDTAKLVATAASAFTAVTTARRASATAARGTHTFAANEVVTLEFGLNGAAGTFQGIAWIEVVFDT